MNKKQTDRRPDQKPAEQGSGKHDPSKLEYGRPMPEAPDKGLGEAEGTPIDKPFPKPETRGGDKDFFEGERSDRQSGRPVQLEDDDRKTFPGQQPKPGQGGRPQEGSEGRKPLEGEAPKR